MTPLDRIKSIVTDTFEGLTSEWLITNSKGGFSSSTAIGCHTRKYHGLLVTTLPEREGRIHFLSSIEENINSSSQIRLGNNIYPGVMYPEGYGYIREFGTLPVPTWIYSFGDILLKKEILMRDEEASVLIVYTLMEGEETLPVELRLLFTFRDSHTTTRENIDLKKDISFSQDGYSIQPYSMLPPAYVSFSGDWAHFGDFYWDHNVIYEIERERGLDFEEDRFVPGHEKITLNKGQPFVVKVSAGAENRSDGDTVEEYGKILAKKISFTENIKTDKDLLSLGANDFLVSSFSGLKSVNAGYPWFGEWGRDTMIALPGLTWCNGNLAWGLDVLKDYAGMIKNGMLPNTIGESQGFTSYNSIDAGLLYCRAVMKLLEYGYGNKSGEVDFIRSVLFPAVTSIVEAFLNNIVPETRLDSSGLISTGNENTQLTWMDATSKGKPVTSRHGYAVELNAMWYDSFILIKKLCAMIKTDVPAYADEYINKLPAAFKEAFWNVEDGFLSDTCVNGAADHKLRPNLLFATSASDGLIDRDIRRASINMVKEKLLTPMGLRTLSPDHSDFRGEYTGGSDERDAKYHQGTVWPWLIGVMVESSLLYCEDKKKELKFWGDYLDNLLDNHLYRQGVGYISEIFDGAMPENGKGCFAQAWSTGELLRAYSLLK